MLKFTKSYSFLKCVYPNTHRKFILSNVIQRHIGSSVCLKSGSVFLKRFKDSIAAVIRHCYFSVSSFKTLLKLFTHYTLAINH